MRFLKVAWINPTSHLYVLFPKEPWVLVVGGHSQTAAYTKNVDLISLDPDHHPVPKCLRIRRQYPDRVRAAIGASVFGKGRDPIVCGGVVSWDYRTDQCYLYSPEKNAWSRGNRMLYHRDWPGGSVHPRDGLIMTGGLVGNAYVHTPYLVFRHVRRDHNRTSVSGT